MTNLNFTIFRFFNGLAGKADWFDWLAVFFADAFAFGVFGLLFLFIFVYLDHRPGLFKVTRYTAQKIGVIGLAGFVTSGVVVLAKVIFSRPRPFLLLENVNTLIDFGGFDSFPSAHSAVFMAFAFATFYFHRRLGAAYIMAAVAIGLARIVVGVHFPIDIIWGWTTGIVIATLIVAGYKQLALRRVN